MKKFRVVKSPYKHTELGTYRVVWGEKDFYSVIARKLSKESASDLKNNLEVALNLWKNGYGVRK